MKGNNNTPKTRKARQERGEQRNVQEKYLEQRRNAAPPIVAKTQNQKLYLKLLRTCKMIVSIGDAGVGKTWVASAMAADLYVQGKLDKIIVARPFVQMGRFSGSTPGDATEKLYPYCRNVMDTLKDRMGDAKYKIALDCKDIEIQALESIRGRSFDSNCFLICDEMQNATIDEVKSIVTRVGEGATVIFCGDTKQSDIKGANGLDYICNLIKKYHIADCGIVEFDMNDCVRSGLVRDFLIAIQSEYDEGAN